MMATINPATGQVIGSYTLHSATDIDAALAGAAQAQADWSQVAIQDRVVLLTGMSGELRKGKPGFAELITQEMGKPITEALGEIEKSAVTCEFYAKAASKFLANEAVASSATESAVFFDPLGVVHAIMPWNYSFWQVFRFIAPALAAGNGGILKLAANVCGCALIIAKILARPGCPDGLMRSIVIDAPDIAGIIADDRIRCTSAFWRHQEIRRLVRAWQLGHPRIYQYQNCLGWTGSLK